LFIAVTAWRRRGIHCDHWFSWGQCKSNSLNTVLENGGGSEAAAVTLRQLNRRCGPLSDATTAEIQALPLERLEALAEALLDFGGPADLAVWLEEHKG